MGLDRERSVTKSVQSAIILLHRKSAEIHGRRDRACGGCGSSPTTQGEERYNQHNNLPSSLPFKLISVKSNFSAQSNLRYVQD